MKLTTLHFILIFLSIFTVSPFLGQTEFMVYTPGPANINPDDFAHIYFLREQDDAFPDNWLAVIFNTDAGFCVKAKMNHIYQVNTKLTGPTTFHTKIKDVKTELSLNLEPGNNYYIDLKPERLDNLSIRGSLKLLEEHDGISRIQSYAGTIQHRYCIVPMEGNHDFRENVWNDTIHWYAGKTNDYYFRALPSWELLLRDKQNTAFAFRNPLISNTYSEAGGIRYLSLKKCVSVEDFEHYCNTDFIKTTLDKQHDSLTSVTVAKVPLPEGITYASMVSIENQNTSSLLPETQQLLMRTVYMVFFWNDQKGKGNTACLYLSERGLPNEIHDMATLQERLLWVWNSFRLVNTK